MDTLRLGRQAAGALAAAHRAGIVHRDLKPDNIFLARDENDALEVKVLDFGIAKLTASEGSAAETGAITGTGSMLGTPYYMAPEQGFGQKDIDHRADIWAIGIIVYECLHGERPVSGDNLGQILKVIVDDGIPPIQSVVSDLPPVVAALVGRMLSKKREERPSDLHEVVDVLKAHSNVEVRPFGSPQFDSFVDSGSKRPASSNTRVVVDSGTTDPSAATLEATGDTADPQLVSSHRSTARTSSKRMPIVVAAVAVATVAGGWLALRAPRTEEEPAPAASRAPVPATTVSALSTAEETTPDAAASAVPVATSMASAKKPAKRSGEKTAPPSTKTPATAEETKRGILDKPPF
jgi:serine/threonine-protein kinase